MMDSEKLLYQIALTQIEGVGDTIARNLLQTIGSEDAIFKSTKKNLLRINGLGSNLVNAILDPNVLRRAEVELEFVTKNKIQTFFIRDSTYPKRLKECEDAPILLYFKGTTDLNVAKIISIVGTRKSTEYGNQFCYNFLEELSNSYPNTLIVSGLAYGIDIQTHRAALKFNLPTIGVLAHGLDRIYPSVHRKTAIDMLENGGLLTEFGSKTEPDKFNFVRRNRIVAGIADATIVVESDVKGGSLITAEIANSYNKEVFALPGRINDSQSKGCNKLIVENKAIILQSFGSFIQQMNWEMQAIKKHTQQELFFDFSDIEQQVYDLLKTVDSLHVNFIATTLRIPVSQLFVTLLGLEMRGVIKPLPGGSYKLTWK